ncbi:MFS general substrate transporter [Aureobasidium pullulans]|uniref:MFS general substrate transporter n=1 Tax=Aureobasidium pullulans TaxID=5580 RepID=A0A4S9K3K8_AURPU|nr:MFS general substrate transporter [Aureobasidium pullulans]
MTARPGLEVPPVAPENTIEQETTPLLGQENSNDDLETQRNDSVSESQHEHTERSVFGIISVLLIGVFVSQADTTLVFATYAHITSEFIRLGGGSWIDGSWIVTSFGLATCATQPMYGRLSQIFGRKPILQMSYLLFLIGTAIAGLARSMIQMIIGRIIQGAGSAGMVSMVSILLTDLVPLHEVAAYRSYVNIFSTVGRSCGGLIGGYLTQTIGWRWAFIGQCPLLLLSIVLVWWKLEEPQHEVELKQSVWTKLKRIDFVGAFFMSVAILACITAFDLGSKKANTSVLTSLIVIGVSAGALFALTEKFWAKEPIFPLELLGQHAVITSYSIIFIQTGIQVALMFLVPLYFQVTANASMGEAGAHLVPAVFGNTLGGLAVGAWIKRTGRYKPPTILASISAMLCFSLLLVLWRGHTSTAGSLVIFFGGCASGMANSAVFVGLTAGVEKHQMAIATTGMYLSSNIAVVAGVSAASAIFQTALRSNLHRALGRMVGGDEVCHSKCFNKIIETDCPLSQIARRVLSDVAYVQTLHGGLRRLVIRAFVASFRRTFSVQIALASMALVIGILSRQRKITR